MESLGLILAVLGGFAALISAVGLALSKTDDEQVSMWLWSDGLLELLLWGLFSFIRGLSKGIADTFRDRSSGSFLFTVIFFVCVIVMGFGIWLM